MSSPLPTLYPEDLFLVSLLLCGGQPYSTILGASRSDLEAITSLCGGSGNLIAAGMSGLQNYSVTCRQYTYDAYCIRGCVDALNG